jgi:hypothetical protein
MIKWGLAAAGLSMLVGCTSAPPPEIINSDIVSTVTKTLPPPAQTYTPPPPSTVAPLPPGAKPRAGEVEKRCPYIASTRAQNATVNVETINGSHVLRTTVLTGTSPVGCRFYFYAPPYQALVDIVPQRFSTPTQARNAMVVLARTGTQAAGLPQIVPGVDAVQFRTKFFASDGARDWACAFAAGNTMVVVYTDRDDQAFNAVQLAKAIAGKF